MVHLDFPHFSKDWGCGGRMVESAESYGRYVANIIRITGRTKYLCDDNRMWIMFLSYPARSLVRVLVVASVTTDAKTHVVGNVVLSIENGSNAEERWFTFRRLLCPSVWLNHHQSFYSTMLISFFRPSRDSLCPQCHAFPIHDVSLFF